MEDCTSTLWLLIDRLATAAVTRVLGDASRRRGNSVRVLTEPARGVDKDRRLFRVIERGSRRPCPW